MHARPWQIPLKRMLWATFLMAVCCAAWSYANFQQLPISAIVLAGMLQLMVLLIAIRTPVVYSGTSAVLGMLTLFLFVIWLVLRVPY
ncbi:MAG: hypothetical protein WD845_10965 [Pirellulales bacterium]